MFLTLLLLFCFINYSGSGTEHVTGTKGGNATLSCELEDHEITVIVLNRQAKQILYCQNEECKSEDGRVLKKGKCDIMLMHLKFSDAGKYILKVYHNNDQPEILEYQVLIQDEISVKIGEKVKLHVLLTNADKVEHQYSNSTEWTKLWKRGEEVQSDRLTDRDETLTISNFTVNDTGIYRVLDTKGEILITLTVTVTESKGKLHTDEDKTIESWIIVVSVIGALLVLVISAVIWKYKCQHKNPEDEQMNSEDEQMNKEDEQINSEDEQMNEEDESVQQEESEL
ncbi:uncharacterized protein LOC125275941 [Megalobrama amblycephala]|uniref:uncharacterized protein LOC125275941 n=1 Tax=Megalobrama amblycephala TaxID=75352 RepID=UPI002013EEE5|nr:uncharacterized protein LOC125275941 [Megalobrama amblycephala]